MGRVNAHAFSHTFERQSVADDFPMELVQQVLGHVSLQTTIYPQAAKRQMLEDLAGYYAGLASGMAAS